MLAPEVALRSRSSKLFPTSGDPSVTPRRLSRSATCIRRSTSEARTIGHLQIACRGQRASSDAHINDPKKEDGHAKRREAKKRKPCTPWRSSSLFTTKFGAVATSVIMPLMSAAKLRGIMSLPEPIPVLCAMRSTTEMKLAVTAVAHGRSEATDNDMSRTMRRTSLLPALVINQSPSCWATPVRTRPSPITKSAAIRTMFGSLKPASASPAVGTPVKGSAQA